jgi:hypothetical protein
MSSERVACSACGKWMFHLAKTCPHCGAVQGAPVEAAPAAKASEAAKPKPELKLSAEEARALLTVTPGAGSTATISFTDIAQELVFPRGGNADLVLTVFAAPLTATTVMVLGYLLLREKRGQRDDKDKLHGLRQLAVPAVTAMLCASLYGSGVPWVGWGALGFSFAAWVGRELLRRKEQRDPML